MKLKVAALAAVTAASLAACGGGHVIHHTQTVYHAPYNPPITVHQQPTVVIQHHDPVTVHVPAPAPTRPRITLKKR